MYVQLLIVYGGITMCRKAKMIINDTAENYTPNYITHN